MCATLAAAVIIGGLVTFAGWWLDVPRFIDWFGLGVTMKANAAIAATLAGLALLTTSLWPRRSQIISTCAFTAAAIGGATLVEHLTGWSLGIDTLLFDEEPGQPGTAAPGRMGPPAATSLLLLGSGLIALLRGHQRFTVSCGLVVLALSTLSLVGYWYGAEAMYTVPKLTGISLQMALLLLALSVGIVVAVPDAGPMRILSAQDSTGTLAWRLLPAAFVIPLATGWVRLHGERIGLYDVAFGAALRTIVEVTLLCALSWWAVRTIQVREKERLTAERERDLAERRFRSVLDAAAVPFCVLTPIRGTNGKFIDFKWSYVNPAAAAVFGRRVDDVTGRNTNDVLPITWDRPGLLDRCVSVLDEKRIEEFEVHSSANGIEGWFHVVASPFDHHVAVWFADITVRKQQELELRRADRRKDEFLATLAHELRNPLAPIRQASMLSRKPALTDAQRQWCNEVIERQVQHMSLLLEDLLDVSRITRGTLQLRRAITTVQSIVQSAVETARPLIDSKKHVLEMQMPTEEQMVNVDSLRMAQIISNLLTNAAKYTDPGGIIQLSIRTGEDALHISVTDNGIGLTPEHLKDIFRMFGQVKSEQERSEGGLGIGLALTKGLVELHGGSIEVDSKGRHLGSTFSVVIPNVVVTSGLGVAGRMESFEHVVSRKILVADDNVDAAVSLSKLLSADGHRVRTTHDGTSAVQIAAEFRPEVVLLDIGMPGMTGYEVAAAIRKSDDRPLLIATTGWGQQSDRARSADAGFDHHLTKPVDYRELTMLLRSHVQRSRSGSGVPAEST